MFRITCSWLAPTRSVADSEAETKGTANDNRHVSCQGNANELMEIGGVPRDSVRLPASGHFHGNIGEYPVIVDID